ncbi:transposase [Mesorhizobium abyssinicae]|uniref:transposase n=1 Tax=Mesorhizobium abyssinicae TaxID=1209958 RepID=UPI0033923103
MSFPRAGKICAAQITAELGDVRARFQSEDHLAAEAGVAPVTYQSGKSRAVAWRWACNKRLRAAVTCFADNSRHASPWAAKVYQDARKRGCRHPHAVRILARAWLRILWRAWQDGSLTIPANTPQQRRCSPKVDTGSLMRQPGRWSRRRLVDKTIGASRVEPMHPVA